MNRRQLKRELGELLERCETTTEFLQGVVSALEELHADDEDNATSRGFEALDQAIDCFAATEADELDDDEEE